jgi:CrcB protein
MSPFVVVAAVVAGALGAVARYGLTRLARRPTRAVLIANIAGSALAGVAIAFPTELQYIVLGGFAGGLTTFSTWSVETMQLMNEGKSKAAAGNVVLNLAAGLLSAVVAYAITLGVLAALTGG